MFWGNWGLGFCVEFSDRLGWVFVFGVFAYRIYAQMGANLLGFGFHRQISVIRTYESELRS